MFKNIFIFFILYVSFLSSGEKLLETTSVRPMMEQFFNEHVEQKKISLEIIENSYILFLEQFDPAELYLLDSEVDYYKNLPKSYYEKVLKDYQHDSFKGYEQLNQTVVGAIERARNIRQQVYASGEALADLKDLPSLLNTPDSSAYADDTEELKTRIKRDIYLFIKQEEERFGKENVQKKMPRVLARYEAKKRDWEDTYLYENSSGKSLPRQEAAHLFSLHILKALAKSLDNHTSLLSDNEASQMRSRLEKTVRGIGIIFDEGIDGPTVQSLVKKGPAYKSGLIASGDVLVKINNQDISNLSFEKAMDILHNASNNKMALVFVRSTPNQKKEEIKTELDPEELELDETRVDVDYEPFGNGIIGKIKLYSFYESDDGISSEKDVKDAITKLKKIAPLKGLVLDLRNNGGGYLSQAVKVAGLFITNGVIVVSKYSTGEEHIFRDVDGRTAYDGPLVILTSRLTASAAEIVAQALQDWGVALVVGDDHTFGKGTIQSQNITGGNSGISFKVTVGKYYTVSGKTPQAKGVLADIVVPGPLMKEDIGEVYLENHLSSDDTLDPFFTDSLEDVKPQTRNWFLRYYSPTLQRKITRWQAMVNILKKNSEKRIAQNISYQSFLKNDKGTAPVTFEKTPFTDWGKKDLQIVEAIDITKDMVRLETAITESE